MDDKHATSFHNSVTQLIFACPRALKDTKNSVSFLTTRVRIPENDDWGKLKHVLGYVRRNINLPLILRAYIITVTK